MKNKTPDHLQEVINKIFADYEANEKPDETTEQRLVALEEALYKALLVKLNAVKDAPERQAFIREKAKEFMRDMNSNDPALTNSEKMLRSIGSSDLQKASAYAEKLEKFKSKTFNIAQKKKAQIPRNRKKHPLRDLLEELNKDYPRHSHVQLRDKLIIEGKNLHLIYEVSDQEETIYGSTGVKDIKFSTVRDWVSEIRKK
jgi:hypothetical protein